MNKKKKTGHPSSSNLRQRAEEELRESEERYRRLIETAPDVIYNLSAEDGTFTLLNPAFERITGWSRAEWLGKPFMPLVHPDDLTLARESFQKVSRGESIPPYELRILSKSGEYLLGEFTSFPHIEKRKVLGEFGIARDITGRRRAEEGLRESWEKHRNLFETMMQGVVYQDAGGLIISANRAAERILGLTLDQMRGRTSTDPRWRAIHEDGSVFPGEEHPSMVALRTSKTVSGVIMGVYLPQTNETRWILIDAIPKFLPGETKPFQVYTTFTDITEHKRTEEGLKISSQLLRDTGEMAKVGGWELDLSTKEVIWTEEVHRIHGVAPGYKPKLEEAINFYAPESRPALEEAIKKAAETGEPYDLESLLIPSGSQDKIWVRSLGKAVYSGGKIVKLAGTFQDIDKYKRAEEALRESEMRFRQVVENIHEVFWIRDFDTRRILYVSPEYETIWGHALEEVYAKGLSFIENVHPEDEERISFSRKALYEEGRPFDEEYRIIRPDHSIRWVRARTYPVFNENLKVSRLAGFAEDITERKLAEKALRISESKLRILSLELSHAEERERRRLALFLHDEIGQSLALLRMKLGEYAGTLELVSGKHDIGQICDVLEKVIDQTHTLTFELSPPILHQLGLEAAIEWAGEKISQDQGIDFIFNDDGRMKPLDVDLKTFLFRCVRELMMNIVKHAKARKMTVSLAMKQNLVYAVVEDNGIGFDTSLLERPAEPVGFGLFSIRERLAAVDGTFELRSEAGRGTRVALSIPVK